MYSRSFLRELFDSICLRPACSLTGLCETFKCFCRSWILLIEGCVQSDWTWRDFQMYSRSFLQDLFDSTIVTFLIL
eukprot:s4781_g1.t1